MALASRTSDTRRTGPFPGFSRKRKERQVPRILVVDDSPDVRLALATILEEAGHEIIEAEDGEQVFDLTLQKSPDLVLLDVMMPRVNGFDALAALKADTRTAGTPVIMVTAKGRPEDMAMARSLGAVEYITKPWSDGDVELRVDWALAAAHDRRR
jgi:DNA-binding response OmpR family regulator